MHGSVKKGDEGNRQKRILFLQTFTLEQAVCQITELSIMFHRMEINPTVHLEHTPE